MSKDKKQQVEEEFAEIEKQLAPPPDPNLVKHQEISWVQFLNSSTKLQSNMIGVGAYVSNPSGKAFLATYYGKSGIVLEGPEFQFDIFVPMENISVLGRMKP